MMSTTLIEGNVDEWDPARNNIEIMGGLVYYLLPTPPGYWLPNSECVVNRGPCPSGSSGDACRKSAPVCSVTSGTADNGWTPSGCQPPVVPQPCDFKTDAGANGTSSCLLGKKVYLLPLRPVADTFPYPCAAGFLGASEANNQISSNCAGRCTAGYCPTERTLVPTICPVALHPAGSSAPVPRERLAPPQLSSASECMPCPSGSWCSTGIAVPCERYYAAASRRRIGRRRPSGPCPADSTTAAQGSFSITQCLCNAGFFTKTADGLVRGEGSCIACPEGANCNTTGLTVFTLPLKSGWWRRSTSSADLKHCTDEFAPQGSGCIGGSAAGACRPSLQGPYCILCSGGAGYYYDSDESECFECTAYSRYSTIVVPF